VYETPRHDFICALRELEMLCLDAETLHQKHMLSVSYAELVYKGKWFTQLRESIDAFMDKACEYLTDR